MISDRVLFQRIIGFALRDQNRPLTAALGLSRETLVRVAERYWPEAVKTIRQISDDQAGTGADALEEPDLRAFLLEYRAGFREEEAWLAAMVARRSLLSNHLWQDLGLSGRDDLNKLFRTHFPELVRLNHKDMKWKKFFYRQLCEREGVPICKAPNCDVCADRTVCFGAESGEPLTVLALGVLLAA